MRTRLKATPLRDLFIVEIDHVHDQRGFFVEVWHQRDFEEAGLPLTFVQENHSSSRQHVLRGLHYQDMTAPMAKLVRCVSGRIFDVAVDLRVSSPTFGRWFGLELDAEEKHQIYVPIGFGHGFVALSPVAEVEYKQTGYYVPAAEGTLAWDDPDIGVAWPVSNPILSLRDQAGMSLKTYLENPAFP